MLLKYNMTSHTRKDNIFVITFKGKTHGIWVGRGDFIVTIGGRVYKLGISISCSRNIGLHWDVTGVMDVFTNLFYFRYTTIYGNNGIFTICMFLRGRRPVVIETGFMGLQRTTGSLITRGSMGVVVSIFKVPLGGTFTTFFITVGVGSTYFNFSCGHFSLGFFVCQDFCMYLRFISFFTRLDNSSPTSTDDSSD